MILKPHMEDLSSVHTITALLFAGLYPNVARIDVPKAGRNNMKLQQVKPCESFENLAR